MLSHYTGVPEQVQIVKAFEHEGDEITHAILTKLNQTFITPFDREDIHELCSQLDDVIDLIDAAASRFVLYRVDVVRPGTVELVIHLREDKIRTYDKKNPELVHNYSGAVLCGAHSEFFVIDTERMKSSSPYSGFKAVRPCLT